MKTETNVYICSKPLQYFNLKNIGDEHHQKKDKTLLVVDAFIGAESFVEKIRIYDETWTKVVFLNNIKEKDKWLCSHKIVNLYVENDLSWKLFCLCAIGRIKKLYVFEEGVGAYVTNSGYEIANKEKKSGLLRWIRRKLGMGLHYGDSKYCKAIFLYKPNLYNRKFKTQKACPFADAFIDNLYRNENLFVLLSGGIPMCLDVYFKNILIYATEWTIQESILNEFVNSSKNYDICYIKPHPHIKKVDIVETGNVKVLHTSMMLELIISYLLKRNNTITIWHQYSTSVVHYVDQVKSVCFPINPEYEKVYNEYVNNK